MVSAAVGCKLPAWQSPNSTALTLTTLGLGVLRGVSGCVVIAQWLDHSYAKREALGSIPSFAAGIFFFPPSQCQCFLSPIGVLERFNWCAYLVRKNPFLCNYWKCWTHRYFRKRVNSWKRLQWIYRNAPITSRCFSWPQKFSKDLHLDKCSLKKTTAQEKELVAVQRTVVRP